MKHTGKYIHILSSPVYNASMVSKYAAQSLFPYASTLSAGTLSTASDRLSKIDSPDINTGGFDVPNKNSFIGQ